MERQFTSCCDLHRVAEDDEIHNVNHEQVEEEATTEGADEDNQEEDWNIFYISCQYSDEALHEIES